MTQMHQVQAHKKALLKPYLKRSSADHMLASAAVERSAPLRLPSAFLLLSQVWLLSALSISFRRLWST